MADKKSAGKVKSKQGKRAVKNQEPKSVGDIQAPIEKMKPREINWDVIGFSSTAITLLGAGLVFMLGWSYEANWYSYFGINISQINIQLQEVLIQSVPGVVTIISSLSACTVAYIILYAIVQFVKQATRPRYVNEFPKDLSTKSKIPTLPYNAIDWIIVLILTELVLLTLLVLSTPSEVRFLGSQSGIFNIYEMTYMEYLISIPFIMTIAAVFLFFIIFSFLAFLLTAFHAVRHFFRPQEKVIFDSPANFKVPQSVAIITFLGFLVILTSLAISAVYGINDATRGIHNGTWQIQKIYVVTSSTNSFQKAISANCDVEKCISGPYALVSENDNSYLLVLWKKGNENTFRYNQGVIILPRTDDIYLIP